MRLREAPSSARSTLVEMVRADEDLTIQPQDKAGEELCLLVVGEDTVQSYRLPSRGEITVGRAEGVGLRIREAWISRQHAILHVGEKLRLEDKGSANGTRVHDRRLKPGEVVQIAIGDVIELGSTTLVVARARGGMPPRRVRSKSHFEERLAEECATAVRLQLGFAVLRVRTEATAGTSHHDQVHAAVVSATRAIDVLTVGEPGEYTILLARTTNLEAAAVVSKIGHPLRARGVRVEIGVASCPQDGRDPESLLSAAKARTRLWEAASSSDVGAPLGRDEKMLQVHALLSRIAAAPANVLLIGETGVGKGVLARQIHALSSRAAGPFFSLNCSALSEDILSRELDAKAEGVLVAARGGTLFLEEVSELSPILQRKLLTTVQDRTLDVRFVSATVRDIKGTFDETLFGLLKGAELSVPPLRERVGDIEELAREFVAHACRAAGRQQVPRISREALAILRGYAWPGNVRELRNVIVRAVVLAVGENLSLEHLPREKLETAVPAPGTHLRTELEDVERKRILAILEQCGGNQSRAAKLLGISRNTLISRLNAYGVVRPRGGGV